MKRSIPIAALNSNVKRVSSQSDLARRLPAGSFPSRSKFKNRKTVVDGISFDSAREAKRWGELGLLERAGEIQALRRQVAWPLHVNGTLICKYRADFDYLTATGAPITEDSKGFKTPMYRIKAKLFRAIYGREILET